MTWEDIKKDKTPHGVSIDGFQRSPEEEKKLNELVASVFTGANGKEVINYLRSITVEAVSGPNVTNDYLRHLEGMRFIVAILLRRITSHNQGGTDARTRIVKPNKRIIK
jgi:uncharacterized tellurite resistance protein B-like protein|tara:strand:- start:208 stop:534 length:327 start_codon:yes stop_codon:yes gene_type:complete